MFATVQEAVNEVASLGVGTFTAGTFVSIIVVMILTGRLTPGKERDYWRTMALELLAQNGRLIQGTETTNRVLQKTLPGQEQ